MKFVKLTDACDFQGGTQPPKSEWSSEKKSGYIRMLQIRDFTQKQKDYTEYVKDKSILKKCTTEDILIGRYGASIGKICKGLEGAYNVALIKTIPNRSILDNNYLFYILQGESFQKFIQSIGSRAAQAGFNKTDLSEFQIPLPSLEQQKKIAAILDAADAYRQKTKALIAKYDELTQSLFLDMFGDPVKNEKGFSLKKLEELYVSEKDGTKCGPFGGALKKEEFVEKGIPVWNMDNISKKGEFIPSINLWINEEKYKVLISYSVVNDDIIISRAGTVGKMCVVKTSFDKSIISTNLIRLRLNKSLLLPLYFVSLMTYFKDRISKLQTGAVGAFTHMNTGVLNDIIFPCPPLDIQNQFAERVQAIEIQKAQAHVSLEKAEELFASLLQKAFKGEII